MTIFWFLSSIVAFFTIILVFLSYKRKTLKYNLPHIFMMLVISSLWLFYNYREITCVTKECIEWQVGANGGVLIVQQFFPTLILFLVIPWFFIILKNTKK